MNIDLVRIYQLRVFFIYELSFIAILTLEDPVNLLTYIVSDMLSFKLISCIVLP